MLNPKHLSDTFFILWMTVKMMLFLLKCNTSAQKGIRFPRQIEDIFKIHGLFLKVQTIIDKGGSRCGSDRRQHTIKGYARERRLGIERRSGLDRRKALRPRDGSAIERRDIFREYSNIG